MIDKKYTILIIIIFIFFTSFTFRNVNSIKTIFIEKTRNDTNIHVSNIKEIIKNGLIKTKIYKIINNKEESDYILGSHIKSIRKDIFKKIFTVNMSFVITKKINNKKIVSNIIIDATSNDINSAIIKIVDNFIKKII